MNDTNIHLEIINTINLKKDEKYAKTYKRFFKTSLGDYAENDIFIGVKVPELRKIAKTYNNISLENIRKLLNNNIHEYRHCGLIILVNKYEKTKHKSEKEEIFNFYLKNTKYINNWDLVDCSCAKIIGNYIYYNIDKINILYNLSKSDNLWERRISIISTHYFIRKNNFEHTLNISKILLTDKEDLINKAVGWMLREVGNRDKETLLNFIKENIGNIPKITLRYSLEKFNKSEREYYYNINKNRK